MGEAILARRGGGGARINGIIEQYKAVAGSDVNAGDFVRFVIKEYASDTSLSTTADTGSTVSAVQLTANSVFIAHSYNSSQRYLFGQVVTISGTTITPGTDTVLSSESYSARALSAVRLTNTSVFIAHSYGSNTYLYGLVVTISGTAMTPGTDTPISLDSNTGFAISAVNLTDDAVFIAHSYGSSRYLYGVVVTISGTTIVRPNYPTEMKIGQQQGGMISAVRLAEDKVFIAHSYTSGSYYYVYGLVVSISGAAIAVGADTQLASDGYANSLYSISAVGLAENRAFIVHSHSSLRPYGVVASISGTTITSGFDTQLSNESSPFYLNALLLMNDVVFITGQGPGLYSIGATIREITIVPRASRLLSSDSFAGAAPGRAVRLSDNLTFIAHNALSNNRLYGMMASMGLERAEDNFGGLIGVSKKIAADGAVDTYIPG